MAGLPAGAPDSGGSFRHDDHPRSFDDNLYVYAVLSRRARGLSVGINLNPNKACNFGCIYCQVDRTSAPAGAPLGALVDEARLLKELAAVLDAAAQGRLGDRAGREGAPTLLRRVADVAFSGDGEPTSYPRFRELVAEVSRVVRERLPGTPLTLITNSTLLHAPRVREAVDLLHAHGGEVWAKLDAGTEDHYRLVNDSQVPFARVLDNIREEALRHPLVVQSLFLRLGEDGPSDAEIDAWARRLATVVAAGGRLSGVQVTTVARRPPRPDVGPLPQERLHEIARRARSAAPGVRVEVFP